MHLRRCLLLALAVAAASAQDVRVASFETDQDNPLRAGGCTVTRVQEHATDGNWSLRVDIKGSAEDTWPGIYLPAGDPPDWSGREELALDIFLVGEQPVQLSTRADAGDQRVFGGAGLRPGWNRGWTVSIKNLGAELDLKQMKQLLLYVRMPRQDVTLYLDNLRWTSFRAGFKRQEYLDTQAALEPSAEERARGYLVSQRPYLALRFANSRPAERCAGLSLFAARGEQEPVTFAVHALDEDLAVAATVSDLVGPQGAKLPASAWHIGVVRHLDKRLTYAADTYLAGTPTYIAPQAEPVTVPAGQMRRFWLTLTVPRGAAPGVYQGDVTLRSEAGDLALPLRVRVLPHELPELTDHFYGEYYRLVGRSDDWRRQIHDDLADMRDHGMTSVGLCFGVEDTSYTVDGEQVHFAFQGDTRFEWFMDAYAELGFPAPVVLLSDSGQGAAATTGAKLGEPTFDRTYLNFHLALAQAAQDQGWPEIYVQPVDEPGWQDQERQQRNVHLLRLLHAAGIKTEQDGPADAYFHTEAGPFADLWNYNGGLGSASEVAQAQADGHRIVFYNNDVEGYRPETDRWAYGLFNWQHQMQGGFNWEYRGGGGDLYDDQDARHGDWVHRYLPQDDHPGGPSTGWEGCREGIDDRRYLALLETLIERGRAAGGRAASEAESAAAVLADLHARLDHNPRVRGRASFAGALSLEQAAARGVPPPDSAVASYVTGDLKQPNGLQLDEYDTIRWRIASLACRLTAALGQGPDLGEPRFEPATVTRRVAVLRREATADLRDAPRPSVRLPVLARAPELDGQVDGDAGWQGAADLALTLSDGSGVPEMPTRVRLGRVGQTLYVAFVCAEDRTASMVASVRETDGEVWKDDCVEVFLDPGPTGTSFYQVVVNSLGTVARFGPDGKTWRPEVTAAANVEPAAKRWWVELAVPVGDLGLAPSFGLNFGRERRPLEVLELSTWSITGGGFGQPERFGVGVIEGDLPGAPEVKPELGLSLSPGWLRLDQLETTATLNVRLPADQMTEATLRLELTGPAGKVEATLPGPLATRLVARLQVGDLPPGDYDVTAALVVGGREAAQAKGRLTRVAGPFDG